MSTSNYRVTKYQISPAGRNQPFVRPLNTIGLKVVSMRSVIELLVMIIFSVVVGTNSVGVIYKYVKKKAVQKVGNGLGSLVSFTEKLSK